MHAVLFIAYSFLCGYGILKLPFFRRSGIHPVLLVAFFAIHVAVGCIHNIIAWRYYPGHGDTWGSFQSGLEWLHTGWRQIRLDNSRWTDLTHNGVAMIDLLLNVVSFDNLYINTLLFAFPVFIGNTALYLVFRRHFRESTLSAVIVYILPSTLFWTACVFREGVLYMLLGFFFYQIDRLLSPRPTSDASPEPLVGPARTAGVHPPANSSSPILTAVLASCCFLLILFFRFTVALFLVPALLAMYWIRNPSRKQFVAAGTIAILVVVASLAIPSIPGRLLSSLARWQAEFQALEGHSRLALPAMDGSWSSLFRTAPYALLNGLFQPLPGAGGRPVYLAFATELTLTWIILILAVVLSAFRPVIPSAPHPLASVGRPTRDGLSAACLVFALLGMVATGAMVPFAGAIVRYRSIYLPFLLAPALYTLKNLPLFRRLNSWLENRL